MNVLHVNTRATVGGAARACRRLHEALRRAGHDSRILSRDYSASSEELVNWLPNPVLGRLAVRLTWLLERSTGLEGFLDAASWLGHRRHVRWADVVNLHNVHGFLLSLPLLPHFESHAPLIWTLHDAWPLTAHCFYPMGCEGWLRRCRECPNPAGRLPGRGAVTRLLYRLRRRVYDRIDPVIVTPSRWLLEMVRRSPLTCGFRSRCIPNGLDLEVFRPLGRQAAREALGLRSEGPVVMFGARSLTRRRKGRGVLQEALERLRSRGVQGVTLLSVGQLGVAAPPLPYPLRRLGTVDSQRRMALAYSAADVFVLPTRADNLPNTLVESIACGTPCVSFRVGGVPEVVRPGETGWLAEPGSPEGLAECLEEALLGGEQERMGRSCRRVAEEEYDVRLMAERYVALYSEAQSRRTEATL